MEELDLGSVELQEVRCKIGSETYVLREADGDAAVKYRNAALRAAKMKDGKVSSMDGLADAEPLLVSLCLFDEKGKAVPLATVRSWPARIQKQLFQRVRDMSELEEKETPEQMRKRIAELQEKLAEGDAAKNERNASEAGSD